MKIGIDAHGVGGHSLGHGNETYFRNLILSLAAIDRDNEYHVFVNHPESLARSLGARGNIRLVTLRPRSQWFQRPVSLPLYSLRWRLDLVHCPFVRPPFSPARTIVTVHDLCFETHPQFFTQLEAARMKALVPASCRNADLIFTVSHFVRTQIHDHYGIPLERIMVTPNAADHIREGKPAPRQDPAEPAPYALYVGLIQPRKNLARVVAAFDRVVDRAALPHHLVLAGARGWGNDELDQAIVSARHRDRIHCLGYCSGERIDSLFANADGFVFPSLFEGFGIPVMEAQRRGVPALASDGSCFPEIYGDSVISCDPLSVDSIADAMQRLLTDEELRMTLVERGRRRAQQFSWERTARIALEGYRRVMATGLPSGPSRSIANR